MLIDIHTHQLASNRQIYNLSLDEIKAEKVPNTFFCCGIHPWWVSQVSKESVEEKLKKIWEDKNCLAIGEIGLDRLKNNWEDQQLEWFEFQLQLGLESEKTVFVLHCVKAFDKVLQYLKKANFNKKMIFHDYNGNLQITRELLKYSSYFSFGRGLFREDSSGYKSFLELPLEKVFLETDDSNFLIEEIYKRASQIRKIELKELENQISKNFKELFRKD